MGRKPGSDKQASAERKHQIIQLLKKGGASLEDIGQQVGVSKQYVAQIADEAGLSAETYFDLSETISTIRELSGVSVSDLARILGTDRESVSRWASGSKRASLDYSRRIDLLLNVINNAIQRGS
jgi:transcriptional regulator with XRE-family HTH domain